MLVRLSMTARGVDSINGHNVKGDCENGGVGRRMESTGLQQKNPRQMYLALNELTEGAVTVGVGSLFEIFKTRIEEDDFLRRRRLGPCRTLKG